MAEEKEIGSNRMGVTLVGFGLTFGIGFPINTLPVWLFALPVGVTVAGLLICISSVWRGRGRVR